MNVYELSLGYAKHFVAAVDEDHAYKQGTDPELFPDIYFLPFTVTQVVVTGHVVTATPEVQAAKSIEDMDRSEMKEWLKVRGIEFTPQWGDDKLREAVQQHIS